MGMGSWGSILLLALFAVLGFGIYLFATNLPGESINYGQFSSPEFVDNESISGSQFMQNMRYQYANISYKIADTCSLNKKQDAEEAFSILDENTILDFYSADDALINILCEDISPDSGQEGYFVAGEGGPSGVIKSGLYAVIIGGKVALYREEKCSKPQVALHEILHSLGFDHNKDRKSIMYPVTACDQILDDYVIDEINELYGQKPYPDLTIENVEAEKSGRYIHFNITLANIGLINCNDSDLSVIIDGSAVKKFDIGKLNFGIKRVINVNNLRVPRIITNLSFIIETDEKEISKTNNVVELSSE